MKKGILALLGLILLLSTFNPVFAAGKATVIVSSVEFVGMDAPETEAERTITYSQASAKVTYNDGSIRTFPLQYNTLFKTTDTINGTIAGAAVDQSGNPIMDTSVAGKSTPYVSDDPDGNSLLEVKGAAATGFGGNPLSLVTQYEYVTANNAGTASWGLVPASMSLSTVDQNKVTGELKVADLKKVDFALVDGLWIPCNSSLSPWNTHLSSEEYEPDARDYESAAPKDLRLSSFGQFYYNDAAKTNPYLYGYVPEVTVNADGTTKVIKHYSVGRLSHELIKMMPDQRTAYMGDDGGNVMLFMYVADKAADLSAGTLYAAKWNQIDDQNGGSANLTWIKLGHASDAEVKAYADTTRFSGLFETAAADTPGFTKIRTYPTGKDEWLKLKPGMEKAAAFLEPRRYGAMLGATAEFNKMEGVALNAEDKKVYIAMSYVDKAMLADAAAPTDDIKLTKLNAGITYELSLADKQTDTTKAKIDSSYVATTMKGLVLGEDLATADAVGNTASIDKVANPDNLAYSEVMRTLFIGEDSGTHLNNFLWAYNVDTKKLSRIASFLAGAEATGLQMVDNLNNFSYIMANMQHPADLEEFKALPKDLKETLSSMTDKKSGLVGYISGLPALKAQLVDGSTPIPIHSLANVLQMTLEWNASTHTVTASKDGLYVVMTIGSKTIQVNGMGMELSEAVKIANSRTVLPAHVIYDVFGADLVQNGDTYGVIMQ